MNKIYTELRHSLSVLCVTGVTKRALCMSRIW